LSPLRRTVDNIRDPLFRFFEREVNAGIQLLSDVRRDIKDAIQICIGEKKQTNHHRVLLAALAKSKYYLVAMPSYLQLLPSQQ
jgi:dynein heavy chain 1, cytosolic